MNNQTIDFRQYLVNKHLSANTIKSYMKAVEHYESMFSQYDAESLNSYKHYMTRNYKPQTINLRILAINKYLSFIGKGDLALPLIKIQHASFSDNVVTPKEYSRMKQGLLNDDDLRWYYMIWTMGATGARVSELVQIKIEDIIHGYVDILSKGDKTRRLYFPIQLRKSVYQWGESQGQLSGYLFTNNRGEPITPRGFSILRKSQRNTASTPTAYIPTLSVTCMPSRFSTSVRMSLPFPIFLVMKASKQLRSIYDDHTSSKNASSTKP